MFNLVDLYAQGTASSYGEYQTNRAKIFFGGFLLIVIFVAILGAISWAMKKLSGKKIGGVEPPLPSNNRIKRV